MKRNNFLVLVTLLSTTLLFSCTKETPEKPALTKTQMLVKSSWQVEEVFRNIDGVNSHYVRTGENTTGTNYSLIRLTFQADGTGTYIDEVGTVHQTNWAFLTEDERNVSFEVKEPYPIAFTWNLVEISESSLSNTTAVGTNTLVSARYTPIGKLN